MTYNSNFLQVIFLSEGFKYFPIFIALLHLIDTELDCFRNFFPNIQ